MKKSLSDLYQGMFTSTPPSPKSRTTVEEEDEIYTELHSTSTRLNYPHSIIASNESVEQMRTNIVASQLQMLDVGSISGIEGYSLTSDHEQYKKSFADASQDQVSYQYYSDDALGPIMIILRLATAADEHHVCYVMTKLWNSLQRIPKDNFEVVQKGKNALRKHLISHAMEKYLELIIKEEESIPTSHKYPVRIALIPGSLSPDKSATIIERFREHSYEVESKYVQECVTNMNYSPMNEDSNSIVAEVMFGDSEEYLSYSKSVMNMGDDAKALLGEMSTSLLLEAQPEFAGSNQVTHAKTSSAGSQQKAYGLVKQIIETEKKANKMYKVFEKEFAEPLREIAGGNIGRMLYPSRVSLISFSDKLLVAMTEGARQQIPAAACLSSIKLLAQAFTDLATEIESVVMGIVEDERAVETYARPINELLKKKLHDHCIKAEFNLHSKGILSSVSWDAMRDHPLKRFINYGTLLKDLLKELPCNDFDYRLVSKASTLVSGILIKVDSQQSAQTKADNITLAISSKLKSAFSPTFGRILHAEMEMIVSYPHTKAALSFEDKQRESPVLVQLYSDRIYFFKGKEAYLRDIELAGSEILPMYSAESPKRIIGFRIFTWNSEFIKDPRQSEEMRSSNMFQFTITQKSDIEKAADFISKMKLAQKMMIYGELRVLQPENHYGTRIHLTQRNNGATFNSKSRILLLLLIGNTADDIQKEVDAYIQQDNLATSWPYYFIGFVRAIKNQKGDQAFQLTLQSSLELDSKTIFSQKWHDTGMFQQLLQENLIKCIRIYNSQIPKHLTEENQVGSWAEMEEMHYATHMGNNGRARMASSQSIISLKIRERTASQCSVSSIASDTSSIDYRNLNRKQKLSLQSSNNKSFAQSTRTLKGGLIRNLTSRITSKFQKGVHLAGPTPNNQAKFINIIQEDNNAVLKMVISAIEFNARHFTKTLPYHGVNIKETSNLAGLLADRKLTPSYDLKDFKLVELTSFLMWMMSNLTLAGALFSQSGLDQLKIKFKSVKNKATKAAIQHEMVMQYVNGLEYNANSALKIFFGHLNIVIQGYQGSSFKKNVEMFARETVIPYIWPTASWSNSGAKMISILIKNADEIVLCQPPMLTRSSSIASIRRVSGNNTRPFIPMDSSGSLTNNSVIHELPTSTNAVAGKNAPLLGKIALNSPISAQTSPEIGASKELYTHLVAEASAAKANVKPALSTSPSKIPVQKKKQDSVTSTKTSEKKFQSSPVSKAAGSPIRRDPRTDKTVLEAISEDNEELKKEVLAQQDSGTALETEESSQSVDTAKSILVKNASSPERGSSQKISPERPKNTQELKSDELALKFKGIEHQREKTSSAKRLANAKDLALAYVQKLAPVVLFAPLQSEAVNVAPLSDLVKLSSPEVLAEGEKNDNDDKTDDSAESTDICIPEGVVELEIDEEVAKPSASSPKRLIKFVEIEKKEDSSGAPQRKADFKSIEAQASVYFVEEVDPIQDETAKSKIEKQDAARRVLKSTVADLRRGVQSLKNSYQTFEIKVDALPTNKTKKEIQLEIRKSEADNLKIQSQDLKGDFKQFESMVDKLPKIETLDRVLQFVDSVQRESEDDERKVDDAEQMISLAGQLNQNLKDGNNINQETLELMEAHE